MFSFLFLPSSNPERKRLIKEERNLI